MHRFTFLRNLPLFDFIAYFLCVLFVIAGSLVSLNRFWQYEIFFYDFGIFDQAIWRVSRLQAPIIDHLVVGGKWIFADHFNPSIFFLTPIYWLTERSEALLVAQTVIVGLSGLVLYAVGKEILRSRFQSLSIIICYLLFVGIQNAVISDFHEVTVMTLPLALTFWAFVKKRRVLYFLFLVLTLGFKESTFLLGVGIGVAIFLLRNSWVKEAWLTIIFSLFWGLASIWVIIPYFSGGSYQYGFSLPEEKSELLFAFLNHPVKQNTFFYSFFSFGFLPFFSPSFWLLIFQDLFIRFIPNAPTRWELGLHYSAQLAPLLATSSFYVLRRFQKLTVLAATNFLCTLLIINAIILYRFVLHGPFGLAYNGTFYKNTNNFVYLDALIKKIPKNKSVMTQNNLGVRFTHQEIFLLRYGYDLYSPSYILIDVRGGQNPNNFFGTKDIDKIIKKIRSDPHYMLAYQAKEQFIFKRIEN